MKELSPDMKKHMLTMLKYVGVLFGTIFIYKMGMGMFMKHQLSNQSPIETVSTMKAAYVEWPSELKAVGSVRTVLGVDITTELAGMIRKIYFKPGSMVSEGTVLVQLNADTENAQLISLRSSAELAKITYERNKAQYLVNAVSKQTVDQNEYNYKSLVAQADAEQATVEKKTLRAPFTGKLGVSYVNPGQYLNVGDKVVTLQTLDPIYVDFFIPQQLLSQLKINQLVNVVSDAFPKEKFIGKITTIEPVADKTTRNVRIEATVANPKLLLLPGMFASVDVDTGAPKKYLTLPQAAVSFNPYGDVVFLVKQKGDEKDKNGDPILTVSQSFVVTGSKRGDQVAILDGLKAGEMVVTSGQLKLKNGSRVAINNAVVPANNPSPDLPDEY